MSDLIAPFDRIREDLEARGPLPFSLVTDRINRRKRVRTAYSAVGVSLALVAVGSTVGVIVSSDRGRSGAPALAGSPTSSAAAPSSNAACQKLSSPDLLSQAVGSFYPQDSVVTTKVFASATEQGQRGIPDGMTVGPGSQIDVAPKTSTSALSDWHVKISVDRLVPKDGSIGSFAQFGAIPGLPETASGSLSDGSHFEVAYKADADFGDGVAKPLGQAFILGPGDTYRIDIYAAGSTVAGAPTFDSSQLGAMVKDLANGIAGVSPTGSGSLADLNC